MPTNSHHPFVQYPPTFNGLGKNAGKKGGEKRQERENGWKQKNAGEKRQKKTPGRQPKNAGDKTKRWGKTRRGKNGERGGGDTGEEKTARGKKGDG